MSPSSSTITTGKDALCDISTAAYLWGLIQEQSSPHEDYFPKSKSNKLVQPIR